MSDHSSARTDRTEPDSADTISGNRSVMPPGWMPVPCSVVAALLARLLDAGPGPRLGVPPAHRGDDVLAGAEDAGDGRRVGHERRVDHAVGVEREHLVDVVGRQPRRSGRAR